MPDKQITTNKTVARSAGVIGSWTMVSRVLGLIRDVISASIFGTSMVWDAFVQAFMIPNFLRRLFGEGALSAAFIPVFTDYLHKKSKDEALKLASVVISILMIVVGGVVLLSIGGISLFLEKFITGPKTELTLRLLRITLPYIIFLSAAAWAMGILNSFKHFTAPALAPVMLNICWIGSLFLLVPYFGDTPEEKIFGLAIGILLGGFLQLAVQIPGLVTRGVKFGFNPSFSHPGLKQIIYLMAPAMFGLAITQLNILIDLILANFVGYGANSTLWYGNRLVQLPLGVFAISLSTAVLPVMSEQAALNDIDKLKQTLNFTMKLVFLILIPASLGLIILRVPIIRLLFEHGKFDAESTRRTASVLLFYSLGLFAYGGVHVVVKAYYSLKDTRTPVRIGVIALISNICLNLILMQYLREGGLALATTLSSILNFTLLVFILRKKNRFLGIKRNIYFIPESVIICRDYGCCCSDVNTTTACPFNYPHKYNNLFYVLFYF